jgi:heme/copper-type cytochrome/quinol oxidase subunit 1
VDLASGNLLLFIAFNFTIGNELPRLGYITVIDAYLAGLFVITGTVVLANVLLKRMQNTGRDALLQRLDKFALWAYPFGYMILIAGIALVLA